jgi:hypothetical protein
LSLLHLEPAKLDLNLALLLEPQPLHLVVWLPHQSPNHLVLLLLLQPARSLLPRPKLDLQPSTVDLLAKQPSDHASKPPENSESASALRKLVLQDVELSTLTELKTSHPTILVPFLIFCVYIHI